MFPVARTGPAVLIAAVALSVFGLTLSGCSGSGQGGTHAALSPAAQKYADCLTANGIVLEKRNDGQVRLNKDEKPDGTLVNPDAVVKASAVKCDDLMPVELTTGSPGGSAAQAATLSACMRTHGYPDFPAPDPTTGKLPSSALTSTDHTFVATARSCLGGGPNPTSIPGG